MTGRQPRAVPAEGLAAAVFDGMGAKDDLIVSLSFAPGLTDRQLHLVYRWLRAVDRSADRDDPAVSPFSTVEPFVHEHLFHARISNISDPRATVRSLMDDLVAAGVCLKDSFFACWEWKPGGVMGPRPDPRAPRERTSFANALEYLDALWNPRADPPASEIETDLKGGFLAQDELILEHRGAPLYFPGFRIAYGVVPFTREPVDERTDQVRRSLVEAFAEGWRTLFRSPGRGYVHPQPVGLDGGLDQIEKIVCGTRVGYLFSVEAVQLLDRPSPASCRFREYELMEAVLAAVTRLGLAPVVNWRRYGTPLLLPPIKRPDTIDIQLWENSGDHSGHPGLDAAAAPGDCG